MVNCFHDNTSSIKLEWKWVESTLSGSSPRKNSFNNPLFFVVFTIGLFKRIWKELRKLPLIYLFIFHDTVPYIQGILHFFFFLLFELWIIWSLLIYFRICKLVFPFYITSWTNNCFLLSAFAFFKSKYPYILLIFYLYCFSLCDRTLCVYVGGVVSLLILSMILFNYCTILTMAIIKYLHISWLLDHISQAFCCLHLLLHTCWPYTF